MKPASFTRNFSILTLCSCIVTGTALASPEELFEGLHLNSDGTSYLAPSATYSTARDNVRLFAYNGNIMLYSGVDPNQSTDESGITLTGNPVSVILYSPGTNSPAANFKILTSVNSYDPVFEVEGATRKAIFRYSDVNVENGSLKVQNMPVVTTGNAQSLLGGMFAMYGSGGSLSASTLSAGILTTSSDATISGLKIGKGGGGLSDNTALGSNSLSANTTGTRNTSAGNSALALNTSGYSNTSFGAQGLRSNTIGFQNVAMGDFALYANTTGGQNTAVGSWALRFKATGALNTAVGQNAGRLNGDGTELATATNSIFIGANTRGSEAGNTDSIVLGTNAVSKGPNTTVIGNSTTTATYIEGETKSKSLRVSGNTLLEGDVVLAEPQGDISMGDYE